MVYKVYTTPIHIVEWENPDSVVVYTYPQDPVGTVLMDRLTKLTTISKSKLLELLDQGIVRQAREDEGESLGGKDYIILDKKRLINFLGRS